MPTDPSLFGSLRRIDAQRHHRFGQRVPLDDAAASERFEAPLRLRHERGGAEKQMRIDEKSTLPLAARRGDSGTR